MFQGGQAALIAQYRETEEAYNNILMTGANLRYYSELREQMLEKFAEAQVGDTTIIPDLDHGTGIIIEKTPEYYRAHYHPYTSDGRTFYEVVDDKFHPDREDNKNEFSQYAHVSATKFPAMGT